MALTKYRLGDLIEQLDNRNDKLAFGVNDARGINNKKEIIKTKADVSKRDFSKFYVVYPMEFVFNHRTSRNGEKFSITYNYYDRPYIFTEDYVVFKIKEKCKNVLNPTWLYMFFCRSEFDRYVIQNSWGSSTEFFNWEDICNVELELPSIEIQKKFVDVYIAMLANQKAYEQGLDDLKLTCDAYIEDLKKVYSLEEIGAYIEKKNERNTDSSIGKVMGLSTKKEFRETQSRVNKNELSNYKIVMPNEIAYVPTTDTWKVLAFAMNNYDEPIVVSPIYEVFSVKEPLTPEYLSLWLRRAEFDRYARFNSWGSARENFTFEEMCNVMLPIPNLVIQKSISNVFKVYFERKQINEQLKSQIKDICPILIKGSLEEARNS